MPLASELKVLLVDDQESMRQLGAQALKAIGVTSVITAESGRAALEQLEKNSINLVISDLYMDNIDGIALLKIVRKHPKMRKMPFVMASGKNNMKNIMLCKKEGVNNFVLKPFSPQTLRRKLEEVVGPIVTTTEGG